MQSVKEKVYVWPFYSRIVHWLIVFSFLSSFFTAFFHNYFTIHITLGYIFGLTLVFRLIWGFIGPEYSLFKNFKFSLESLKDYFKEKITNRWRKIHPGHNAASSWFTLIVLGLGIFIVLSGMMLYGIQGGSGLFASLNTAYFSFSIVMSTLHTTVSYLLLFWALIHIAGVLIEQFYHRTQMVFAMLTGYKNTIGHDSILTKAQAIFAVTSLLGITTLCYVLLHDDDNLLVKSIFERRDYSKENSAFFQKCSKCHKNYPPFMLPEESWEKLMDGLDNHFGERITENNITKSEQMDIKAYLIANSAEHSTHKLAYKTRISLGEMRPLSITKAPYWRKAHSHLSPEIFKSPLVKDKSNCFVCHKNFEYGIFDNRLIHIP